MSGVARSARSAKVDSLRKPASDAFELTEVIIAAFDPPVGDRAGVVEGDDFVSPLEESPDQQRRHSDGSVVLDQDVASPRLRR